jgi:hypothetical protein
LASELLDKKLEEFAEEPIIIVDESSTNQSNGNSTNIVKSQNISPNHS